MRATFTLAVPAIALGVLLTAGCGGHPKNSGVASVTGQNAHGSAAPSATPSESRQQQALDYARCMRAHGVDIPDPNTNGGGIKIQLPDGVDRSKVDAAQQACRQYLPNGGTPPTLRPDQIEQVRKLAQCMRQHGVNVPDPNPNTGALQLGTSINPDDPNFKSAMQACRSTYSGPLVMSRGGPGGGK